MAFGLAKMRFQKPKVLGSYDAIIYEEPKKTEFTWLNANRNRLEKLFRCGFLIEHLSSSLFFGL